MSYSNDTETSPTKEILNHYGVSSAHADKITTGLINATYLIHTDSEKKYILQRLNPMFSPEINLNLELVTCHLKAKGFVTPELIYTKERKRWVDVKGEVWRLLSYVAGDVHMILLKPEMARNAGALFGRMHAALFELESTLKNSRPAVHNLPQHINFLSETLRNKHNHPRYREVFILANEILVLASALPKLPATTNRVVHGDPKTTNIIFKHGSDQAVCFIDLDNVTTMPLYLELGDAMRSWCNPNGEDRRDGFFSLELFEAAIQGYASETSDQIEADEWNSIVPATQTIFIGLAARFCADALNENYFAWNPERFPSHCEHNITRATGQLNAAKSLIVQRKTASDIVDTAFGNR